MSRFDHIGTCDQEQLCDDCGCTINSVLVVNPIAAIWKDEDGDLFYLCEHCHNYREEQRWMEMEKHDTQEI